MVTQILTYKTLSYQLAHTKFTQDLARSFISKLVGVVAYMHETGICHRDLKPDNLMYDPTSSTLKIIDFDISKNFLNAKEIQPVPQDMWTVTGTLSYKAPQMLRGGGYNEKVDLWAIGVILFQMLTQTAPFERQYQSQTIEAILKDEPDYLLIKESGSLCLNFLKRLLIKDPEKRISAMEALEHPYIQSAVADDMTKSQNKKASRRFQSVRSSFNLDHNWKQGHDFPEILRIGQNWLTKGYGLSEEQGEADSSL